MTRLVKDAVGFDQVRGDSVNVVNASFLGEAIPEAVVPEEIPLWERPLVRDLAKLGAGLIVLLALVFVVLRPLVRGLLDGPRQALAPALPDGPPRRPRPQQKARSPAGRSITTRRSRRHAHWSRRTRRVSHKS